MKLKKLFALSLGMGLGVSLLSCGNNNNTTKPNVDSTTTTVNTTTAQTTTDTSTSTSTNTSISTSTSTQTSTTDEQLYVIEKGDSNIVIYNYYFGGGEDEMPTVSQIESDFAERFETNGTVTHGAIEVCRDAFTTVEYKFTKNGQTEIRYFSYLITGNLDYISLHPCLNISIDKGLVYETSVIDSNVFVCNVLAYNPSLKSITIESLKKFEAICGGVHVASDDFLDINWTISEEFTTESFLFGNYNDEEIPEWGRYMFTYEMLYKQTNK